jgi:hypothetical protein
MRGGIGVSLRKTVSRNDEFRHPENGEFFIEKTLVKFFTMWQFLRAFNRTVGMTESVSP